MDIAFLRCYLKRPRDSRLLPLRRRNEQLLCRQGRMVGQHDSGDHNIAQVSYPASVLLARPAEICC